VGFIDGETAKELCFHPLLAGWWMQALDFG